MRNPDDLKSRKQRYYSRPSVVASYDAWRFGSPGGHYVNEIELEMVLRMLRGLDRHAAILDCPCGTGRLTRALVDAGYDHVSAADFSPAMLEHCRQAAPSVTTSQQDAFATDFADASFHAVVALRFLFHTATPERLFAEWRRILAPGGIAVFDVLRWTPRHFLPVVGRLLGGKLLTHSYKQIEQLASDHDFRIVAHEPALALPSLAYRFVPAPGLAPLAWTEAHLPKALFTKTFYQLQRK